MSTISKPITTTVTLGTSPYGDQLTITPTGSIIPASYSAAGLISPESLAQSFISNKGSIAGGAGDDSMRGGTGILLQDAARFLNAGTITGGTEGGTGASLSSTAILTNAGQISGGAYDGTGVDLSYLASLDNTGTIAGGNDGGVGVVLDQLASASNFGTIIGGSDGRGLIVGASAHAFNAGTIQGGYADGSSYSGAYGAYVSTNATLINTGYITGGGNGASSTQGPRSGTGVYVNGGTLTNRGQIEGGAVGGYGVSIRNGMLLNTGAIVGGAGAKDYENGAGVYLNGSTLVTSGIIVGGTRPGYAYGNAVELSNSSTLVVEAGAKFDGVVESEFSVNTLSLGTGGGTITGLGTEFAGSFLVLDPVGATWDVAGANSGADDYIHDEGTMDITGTLHDAGGITVSATGAFNVEDAAQAQVIDVVTLQGGLLNISSNARFQIGTSYLPQTKGAVNVNHDATLSGDGTVSAPGGVIDNGTIAAQGQLTLAGPVSGTGTIRIASDSTITVTGKLTVSNLMFSTGSPAELTLASTAAIPTRIADFSTGDTVLLTGITASTLTFSAGTLNLYNGTTEVDQLHFTGALEASDFVLSSPRTGETSITYAAPSSKSALSQHSYNMPPSLFVPEAWSHLPSL